MPGGAFENECAPVLGAVLALIGAKWQAAEGQRKRIPGFHDPAGIIGLGRVPRTGDFATNGPIKLGRG